MKCDCQCHPVENSGFRKQYKPGDKRKLTVCSHCIDDEYLAHQAKSKKVLAIKKWWEFWKD